MPEFFTLFARGRTNMLLQSKVDFLREKLSQTIQQSQSEREHAGRLHQELLAQVTPVAGVMEQQLRLSTKKRQQEKRLPESLQKGEVHALVLPPLKPVKPGLLKQVQRSVRRMRRRSSSASWRISSWTTRRG